MQRAQGARWRRGFAGAPLLLDVGRAPEQSRAPACTLCTCGFTPLYGPASNLHLRTARQFPLRLISDQPLLGALAGAPTPDADREAPGGG